MASTNRLRIEKRLTEIVSMPEHQNACLMRLTRVIADLDQEQKAQEPLFKIVIAIRKHCLENVSGAVILQILNQRMPKTLKSPSRR